MKKEKIKKVKGKGSKIKGKINLKHEVNAKEAMTNKYRLITGVWENNEEGGGEYMIFGPLYRPLHFYISFSVAIYPAGRLNRPLCT
jgi:hypothetical protein